MGLKMIFKGAGASSFLKLSLLLQRKKAFTLTFDSDVLSSLDVLSNSDVLLSSDVLSSSDVLPTSDPLPYIILCMGDLQ